MQLGTVDDLARAIGFDPGVQTTELRAAVEAGTQNVIAALGTELDRAAIVDQFYIRPGGSIQLGGQFRTRLALSRGFIDGPITLLYGSVLTDISLSFDSTTSIIAHEEKGEVIITGPDLTGQYIAASYTAGFSPDTSDDTVYGGVPEWLTEVALIGAMYSLDANQPSVRFDKAPGDARSSANALRAQMLNRIGSRARFFPNANRPL
jgi:hypothetical protein